MVDGVVPLGTTAARVTVTVLASTAATFSLSGAGVAGRSLVNETMPAAVQGRIFAAQNVLSNLASIPPTLFAGLLAELTGFAPVMIMTVVILVFAAAWSMANAAARQNAREHAAA
jgi:hypothetical protein